jgi:hypothetical protein
MINLLTKTRKVDSTPSIMIKQMTKITKNNRSKVCEDIKMVKSAISSRKTEDLPATLLDGYFK